MEEDLIIEVWDVFKEYITEKNKDTAAHHFVDFLIGKDVDISVLKALVGYDTHLDDAIDLVTSNDNEDENRDEEEWDPYDDEE